MEMETMELESPVVQLKKLSPKHKQVVAMVAQGIDRAVISEHCGIVPEYIPWLMRQPLCQEYLREMNSIHEARLECLFEQSVDAIDEGLRNGTADERLKAARLQMEATRRIGRDRVDYGTGENGSEHLEQLANRLVGLLGNIRKGTTYEGETVIEKE